MTILPLAYLPSVEYFWHLSRGGCVVDLGERQLLRVHVATSTMRSLMKSELKPGVSL